MVDKQYMKLWQKLAVTGSDMSALTHALTLQRFNIIWWLTVV